MAMRQVGDPGGADGKAERMAFLVYLSLGALVVNFSLDFWRRYDFHSSREEARKEVARLIDKAVSDQVATSDLFNRLSRSYEEYDRSFSSLRQLIDELRDRVASLDAGAAGSSASGDPNQPIEVAASAGEKRPYTFLETPMEEMQVQFEAMREDKELFRLYNANLDPKTWDIDDLIATFEKAYGLELDGIDRDIVKLEIESFQAAAHAAFNNYTSSVNRAAIEKFLAGDYYETVDDGENIVPVEEVPRRGVFAKTEIGKQIIVFRKEVDTELYRKGMVFQYAPLAMLKHLQKTFEALGER